MAMPVYSDKALDACIARSVVVGPTVSRMQQQQAWERVRQRAEQQTQLPPIAASVVQRGVSDTPPRAVALLTHTTLKLARALHTLISNEEALLRAYSRPQPIQRRLRGTFHGGFVLSY